MSDDKTMNERIREQASRTRQTVTAPMPELHRKFNEAVREMLRRTYRERGGGRP